ncbi:glycerate kinase [Motiliproteus sp. MSK22-1]|uniref:glycerate kinase n=1 Tax=Motiliproteus sp. MSK22-1 TaxID=1897630 RepID=UPI0009773145|nr:glycerate kinase [Motiliproteus sp. MSK22-1]OMH29445.1 glycerate kinase [Motiliproteus sp. MSK22-1]
MKILIAPDSFKESLAAEQVAFAIESGFREVFPNASYVCLPVADGGEGTTDSLVSATKGILHHESVTGPMGEAVKAQWGTLGRGQTAVIEMAAASGLERVAKEDRNPLLATSYGTGELIMAAMNQGIRHIIVGLGGSATNDAGAGMMQALGLKLSDAAGEELPPGGGALSRLAAIDTSALDPRLSQVKFEVACDVDNPLIGPQGASAVFGPQKGADSQMVSQLDANLAHFSDLIRQTTDLNVSQIPGAGAAGGLGAGFLAFTNAELKSGIDIVLDAVDIDSQLADTDLVITGEGRIDSQSIRGKTPVGVAKRAKLYKCPVIALAGSVEGNSGSIYEQGIDAVFSVVPGVMAIDDALQKAEVNIRERARNIAAVWALARG